MKTLNDYFNKIYCINLDRRPERWDHFQEQSSRFNIKNVERFSAVDGNTEDFSEYNFSIMRSELGLVLTNIKLLNIALEKKYPQILITEDDALFTDELFNIEEYFKALPTNWDLLYFGGNHNTHKGWPPPEKINGKVVKIHSTYTTHCIGVKFHMYKELIALFKNGIERPSRALDVSYLEAQKSFNAYCFRPSMAKQVVGYSDIRKEVRDYNNWIK